MNTEALTQETEWITLTSLAGNGNKIERSARQEEGEGMMKIFLSSTFRDLESHRSVLLDTLRKMGPDIRILAMEDFGASASAPIELSLKKVKEADIYVGVFGWRYGTIDARSNMSITEAEYRTALAKRIPVLLYMASEDYAVKPSAVEVGEGAIRIATLKKEMAANHVIQPFATPEDLSRRVATDIHNLLIELSHGSDPAGVDENCDGPVDPEINPAHPYMLCHYARPSERSGWYYVEIYVDIYHERGTAEYEEAMKSVDRVVYQLHDSFHPSVIPMQNAAENWRVRFRVWGEFWVRATIWFKAPGRGALAAIRFINLPDDCLEKRPDLMEMELGRRMEGL